MKPPRFATRLLHCFCPPHRVEEMEGDLDELFQQRIVEVGLGQARSRYVRDVLSLLRPSLLKRQPNRYPKPFLFRPAMLRNYFTIAFRSLWKNKASTFINLFGLTVGLSSCLLIALYIQHELSFDTFQPKGDRIARVIMEYNFDGSPEPKRGNFTSTKVAPVFARTFPEVESAVRMTDRDVIIRHRNGLVTEPNFMFADSTFFQIFSSKLLQGNPHRALDGPHKVVLTESAARKYFGDKDPMGKVLITGTDTTLYEVTGVMADYPTNSQLKFDFLASFSSLGVNQEETYFEANYTTYLLLKDARAFEPLQAKITPFMQKEMAGSGASVNFLLEPFDKIHLYSEYAGFVPNTSITYIYILAGVAGLILIIVCFTYINLSTARSIERAREVGVRKVVGAARPQLFWQFIGESGLLYWIAILLSLGIAVLALPGFNTLTEKQLSIRDLFSPSFLLLALLITVVVTLLAGSYPALVLTGFQPTKVLKGAFRNTDAGKWIQQGLIVFQFAIAMLLIVSTFIVQQQLHFIQHKKLGYNRDHVLVLPMNQKMLANLDVIKQELKVNPAVVNVSGCVSTPVSIVGGYNMRTATMAEKQQIGVTASPVDEDYLKTTGLQLIAGQDLTKQDIKDVASDKPEERTYHFILNESAARQLGWTPEQAINKKMFMGSRVGFVRGVINDFHFESMRTAIKPVVLFPEIRYRQLLVNVSGYDVPGTIAFIEGKWKSLVPYIPFEYRFLDDDYEKLYRTELQLGKVMNLFTSLSIILACLGLFGLTSYIVQQRIKEIGIRKVLGASLLNIVGLLSGNFTKLVLIAVVVAMPIAYVLMDKWLQGFVYRIDMEWWMFVLAGLLAIGIALLTVSFQTIKAALMNPVKSLRSE